MGRQTKVGMARIQAESSYWRRCGKLFGWELIGWTASSALFSTVDRRQTFRVEGEIHHAMCGLLGENAPRPPAHWGIDQAPEHQKRRASAAGGKK